MSDLAILGAPPLRQTPFAPWPQHQDSDLERIIKQVQSGHWGGFPVPSPLAGQFASDFAAMQGARHGLCLSNGTIAIQVALQAAGISFGDEVIVPAYTWDGTAIAVLAVGGVPIFADIDPDTYCLDVESVRESITAKTRAVIPVHLAMRFTNMEALGELAAKHGMKIMEDCAHAHGASWNGRGAGSMGGIGCFSFQESKLMTGGEGGIVITSNDEYFEAMQTIVNCGRPSPNGKHGIKTLGFNYRMTELQAALLIGQLEMLPDLRRRRTEHAALLTELLDPIECVRTLPPQPGITNNSLYNYVFQYRPGGSPSPPRDLFVAALEAEGIPCEGRFYEPVYSSDLFYATPGNCAQLRLERETPIDYSQVHCPVSERAAYEESVWIPQTTLIGTDDDVRDVARAIEKIASNLGELSRQDPGLAGLKAVPRGERARLERNKNY